MKNPKERWINVLNDEAVTFAANVWGIGKAETWGRLNSAIKADELSGFLPFNEFKEYVQLIAKLQRDKKLFKYLADRHGLDTDKILDGFKGDYDKAINYINRYIPANLVIEKPKPETASTPVRSSRKETFVEKISATIFTGGVIIFWIIFAVLFIYITSYYSNTSYDVPEPEPPHADYDPALRHDIEEESLDDPFDSIEPFETSTNSSPCLIKGNISIDGEKIYHIPGQAYYEVTTIDTAHGERWFCTEDEARAAGWRKSHR